MSVRSRAVPPEATIERWCWDLIHARELALKLAPPEPPDAQDPVSWETPPHARRISAPQRPVELRVTPRSQRTPKANALRRTAVRASLLHTLLHHELQAAELFAWGVLAFADTPRDFRVGLLHLCQDELRHLALYARHLERLGHAVGDFPVRDWFWERVARCEDPLAFVSLQGLGLEAANLEHSARFAREFRAAGDEEGARILEQVEREEVAHVAFARRWFERFSGSPLDYDRWRAVLPKPLTPAILRGRNLNRAARLRAGLGEDFLARLEAEPPTHLRRSE